MIIIILISLFVLNVSIVKSHEGKSSNSAVKSESEIFASVPVAVVYDGGNREKKLIKFKNNSINTENIPVVNPLENITFSEIDAKININESVVKNEKLNIPAHKTEDLYKDKEVGGPESLINTTDAVYKGYEKDKHTQDTSSDSESNIPVSIIYDPIPEYLLQNGKASTTISPQLIQQDIKSSKNEETQKEIANITDIMNKKSRELALENSKSEVIKTQPSVLLEKNNGNTNKGLSNNARIKESNKVDNTDVEIKFTSLSETYSKNSTDTQILPDHHKDIHIPRTNRRQQRRQKNNAQANTLKAGDDTKIISQKEGQNNKTDSTTDIKPRKRTRLRDPVIPILQSENYVFADKGDFHYSYESGDGTKASERGHLRTIDENAGEAVVGSFSYIGKDGNDYSITYTADENGYRPVGAHLPTPPPIPPAIARALKYLATKTTPEPVTEPSD